MNAGVAVALGCLWQWSAAAPASVALEQSGLEDLNQPLIVLFDNGRTVSSEPFIQTLAVLDLNKRAALVDAQRQLQLVAPLTKPVSEAAFFPLTASQLVPGPFAERRVPGLTQTLFVVGLDALSLAWLESAAPRLMAIGARGIVVQAEGFDEFDALRQWGRALGLPVDIGQGDALASVYQLHSYPVLLLGDGVSAQ